MPKKIDYVVVAPTSGRDAGAGDDTPEEEAQLVPGGTPRTPGRGRPGGGPGAPGRPSGGRPPARGGAARPVAALDRTGPGNSAGRPGFGGQQGGGNRFGGGRGGFRRAGWRRSRRCGNTWLWGRTRGLGLGIERPTPKVAIPPYLTVKELGELMNVNPTE